MSELPPQLRPLHDFYRQTALRLPAGQDFVHAPALTGRPAFFALANLQHHLNNPFLTPAWFTLYWQGGIVDCSPSMARKRVQKGELAYFTEDILDQYLARGAALMLRGIEFFESGVNAMCAAIDSGHESVMSSAVALFTQRAPDGMLRLADNHHTLLLHLEGQSIARIGHRGMPHAAVADTHQTMPADRMQAEITLKPGDALFLKCGIPYQLEAADTCALQLCFDICDQSVDASAALGVLAQMFDLDASACYTPADGVVEKLLQHANSPEFVQRLRALSATQSATCRQGRALIGNNRVTHFSRLTAIDGNARG